MKLEDEMQTLLLQSWDILIATLSDSVPGGKLTMEIIIDSLLNEEARRKERGFSMQSKVNVTKNHGRNENHRRNNGRGKSRGDLNLTLN